MRNLSICALLIGCFFLVPSSAMSAPEKNTAKVAAKKKAVARAEVSDFTLDTIDGDSVSLSDFKGKVVVVSFWATWCKPCIQELGYLTKLHKQLSKDIVVLAISTDGPDSVSAVEEKVQSKGLDVPVLLDPSGDVLGEFNPGGSLPFSVYIDRDGRLHSTHDGFASGDEIKIEKVVKQLVAEKAGKTKK